MASGGGLRAKIITWSFVPTAIILAVVALVSLYAQQRLTEGLVIDRDQELTRLSASLLAADLAATVDPMSDRYLVVYDDVVMFDISGAILSEGSEQFGWLKGTLLRRLIRAPGLRFSDVTEDALTGERYVVAVIPQTGREGELREGIAALFRLGPRDDSLLYQSIEKARRQESSALYLVDGRGQVIYHSNPAHLGADFSAQRAVQELGAGESGAIRTRNAEGQEIVASFSPVPGTTWGLVTEESWALLMRSSWRYQRFLLLLLAAGLVAPTLIVIVGVKRITGPVAELIGAARQIAGGDLSQRIAAPAGGELEELAEQFNRMAAGLEESYACLERKVDERTRQLQTLNAVAAEASRSLDLAEILNNALARVLDVTGLEKGLAFRLDEETGCLVLVVERGFSGGHPPGCGVIDPAERAMPGDEPAVWPVSEYAPGGLGAWLALEGVQAVIGTPLVSKGRLVGLVDAGLDAGQPEGVDTLALLTSIGHQVGMAVENARLYEQAQQLAIVKERNRLAHDLHDSVTQALYGVTLCVEAANRQLSSGEVGRVARHLREIQAITQEALREMRLLIFELSPPLLKQAGLATALRARLEAVEERAGLKTELIVDGDGRLPPKVEEGLYRVAQEALNNTLKHAHGEHVQVRLHRAGPAFVLEIADDGTGFDPGMGRERGGFGLRGMQERVAHLGGSLTIDSSPGRGTRIRVEVCQP